MLGSSSWCCRFGRSFSDPSRMHQSHGKPQAIASADQAWASTTTAEGEAAPKEACESTGWNPNNQFLCRGSQQPVPNGDPNHPQLVVGQALLSLSLPSCWRTPPRHCPLRELLRFWRPKRPPNMDHVETSSQVHHGAWTHPYGHTSVCKLAHT